LVIKISAIRILARRRRVNFGFRVSDLPALEVSFLESANGGSAEASAKADFEFFAEIRLSQTPNSLPNNYLQKTDPQIQHNSSNLAHHWRYFESNSRAIRE
jgi:hypothetical protein